MIAVNHVITLYPSRAAARSYSVEPMGHRDHTSARMSPNMERSQSKQPLSATSAFAGPARHQRPKVVYVMGAGRSGSTILGITLGNCTNFFYAGELDKWLTREGVSRLGGAERARFWSEVREGVDGAADLFGGSAQCLERSSALFNVRSWPTQRRLRQRYRRIAEELNRAIARAARVTHIVDTSAYPRRARELQSLSGIDLYLLFLVRDPQSVVASWGRDDVNEPRFDMPKTNAYLWLTYLLSVFVFLRHPRNRRLLLRHEAFVADPEGVLRDIFDWIGSSAAIPDLTALDTGLAFHGNRVVRSGVVALDTAPSRPPRASRLTAIVQLPWAIVFSRLQPAARTSAGYRP
jgi:Sulfotransferase family